MESSLLGLVLDSSILIAVERRKLTPHKAIETVQATVCEIRDFSRIPGLTIVQL